MKKLFIFLLSLFIFPSFALALSVGGSATAENNIYGYVGNDDEIDWNNNWYYLIQTGSDGSDCKNVQVLLSNGLSFSKTRMD